MWQLAWIAFLGSPAPAALPLAPARASLETLWEVDLGPVTVAGGLYGTAVCPDGTAAFTDGNGRLARIGPDGARVEDRTIADLEGVLASRCAADGSLHFANRKREFIELVPGPPGSLRVRLLEDGGARRALDRRVRLRTQTQDWDPTARAWTTALATARLPSGAVVVQRETQRPIGPAHAVSHVQLELWNAERPVLTLGMGPGWLQGADAVGDLYFQVVTRSKGIRIIKARIAE